MGTGGGDDSEDPYLVGAIGTAYVEGLQSAGVNATLKHFAGYAASRAGRNMAPVGMGPREFADVILPPFEMAIRLGGARSVMPSYADLDGMPPTGDGRLLTEMLRDEIGFDGVVVSDYYAISFLETQHGVAGSSADAAAIAVTAGVDVELPSVRCYGEPLATAVRDGRVDPDLVDRAVARVLRREVRPRDVRPRLVSRAPRGHGGRHDGRLADGTADGTGRIDLDPQANRSLARRLAEESVILLANGTGALPRSTQAPASPSSARSPTIRSPSSGVTPCPGISAPATRKPRTASR